MALRPINISSHTAADDFSGRIFVFLLLSGLAVLATALTPLPTLKPLFFGGAAGLLTLAALAGLRLAVGRFRRWSDIHRALRLLETETQPTFVTDLEGTYAGRTLAAREFGDLEQGAGLAALFTGELDRPHQTIETLARKAADLGSARQTLRSGQSLLVKRGHGHALIWTLSVVADQGPDALLPSFWVTASGEITQQNKAAIRFFGEARHPLSDCVIDLPLRHGGVHRFRTEAGEREATAIVSGQDGRDREVTIVPTVRAENRPGTVLAQPELLETLPVPMLKIAADGGLIEANAEARSILQFEHGAELPPLFELVEGMGRSISDWLADAVEGRGLLRPEIVRVVVPGHELFLQITLGRMYEGDTVVLVGILNDATELKTLEAQFVQSQKMQAIGQLAGGVAHDFNNLLTAIGGHCDLLLLRHDAGDPEYSDLIQISQNANRAASLVGQFLAFSRKQNLKPQPLDIRDTMSDLAHLLNRLIGERIRLEVTHEPGPQIIRADRRQLEQVIVNLAVNSRDAMPDGGRISIRTRPEFLAVETIRDRARMMPGNYVIIEVSDTGVGINPEGLSKIFEPFYTTKNTGEGTGLGLSTAYGIVKQTGGYIFVDSTPGAGTIFSLYFPATQKRAEDSVAEKPVALHPARGDGVILLVEDEAPVRAFAARALRLRGYTVIEAECAEDALEVLSDDALSIDVFVTDVVMPGMDGPTWVRKALTKRPETRVVFMSGYAEERRAEKQARIPNSVFLPKPFSLLQLTNVVQEQFG